MTYRPRNYKERIIHRLKIVQGHLKKVISMIEDDEYCIDVLHQSLAVQSSLKEIDNLILQNHLQTCVVDDIKSGNKKKSIDEIMKVFKKIK